MLVWKRMGIQREANLQVSSVDMAIVLHVRKSLSMATAWSMFSSQCSPMARLQKKSIFNLNLGKKTPNF